MAEEFRALAIDLGASNGRAVLGTLRNDGTLEMQPVRRFVNRMEERDGTLRWDFEALLMAITEALSDCVGRDTIPRTVGIDTWGVDYVLFDKQGKIIEDPVAYRDKRTEGIMERVFREVVPAEEIYSITGIQFMPINTLYQLASDVFFEARRLRQAGKLLMMPDAFAYSLSGKMAAEYTIASTTQMLDARNREWSQKIIDALDLPKTLFPEMTPPVSILGKCTLPEFAQYGIDVAVPAGHDTAAAVAAVPSDEKSPWAYISSGTWTLVGVEGTEPILTAEACEFGLTNEGGVNGTFRQLKNVTGLWLIQECMRIWEQQGSPRDIGELCRAAAKAPRGGTLIDPDHPSFLFPDSMIKAIGAFCEETGQAVPSDDGALARCVFESLALKSRLVLDRLASLTSIKPEVIHMVGGGTKNGLLCQMTADAAGKPLVAGPAEATAAGNLLLQAMAAKRIQSLDEVRRIVRDSFDLTRYEPSGDAYWDKRYERFRQLCS